MTRSATFRALVLGALSALGVGCFGGPVDLPAAPLTRSEQKAVVACQKTISRQVSKLAGLASVELARCAHRGLALRLEEERELNSVNLAEYLEKRQQAREACTQHFARVGRATTKLIDAVLRKCTPVEALIIGDPLRGDPLGLRLEIGLEDFTIPKPANVLELAGTTCGSAIASAEMTVSFSHRRIGDLVAHFYGIFDEADFFDLVQASFDPRCDAADPGL